MQLLTMMHLIWLKRTHFKSSTAFLSVCSRLRIHFKYIFKKVLLHYPCPFHWSMSFGCFVSH
uniref:K+ efflux antiporter 6-like isoform X3 n=1 Tax=Rhizophora mucronata TaxID=61149 RepID=A0A2P2M729_RHIMU